MTFPRQQLWYKLASFYQVNVRAFYDSNGDGHGDLAGVTKKLDYFSNLGVDCLWLMPLYPSPLKDDGYDISDFYNIQEVFGTVEDLRTLINEAHARGIRIIMDLVMNHTSDQHPWFQAGRADKNSPYYDYYVWSDTREKYQDARVIFLDTLDSNWSWDEAVQQYYWHRFYASQPDLNYENPAVQQAMRDVMKFWLDLGIDGFRADAVPYLFEREGTNCENLPETHEYLRSLRSYLDSYYPHAILLAEANQWPKDVLAYFHEGNEFHMGFHFPLMPRIFMALKQEDRSSLVWIIDETPPIPDDCQWCTFLRNHDELTLEMVTPQEREWMWQEYAPDPRMRLNLGIRRRLAPLLDNDQQKIRLAFALLFSLPGTPIIYYGDEIGMGDNIWLFDRNGVRTPMQWDNSLNAGFSTADPQDLYAPVISEAPYSPAFVNVKDELEDPQSLLMFMHQLVKTRKENPIFSYGDLEWLRHANPSIAAFTRSFGNEMVVVLNNLSSTRQEIDLVLDQAIGRAYDLWAQQNWHGLFDGNLRLSLGPHQFLWLQFHRQDQAPPLEGADLVLSTNQEPDTPISSER